jgi:hypothetical protein
MVGAIQRGGGELIAAYGEEPDELAAFTKRCPDVKTVKSDDEILNDASLQLVLSSTVANHRAPLGVRVMEHGKDFLSDKPGVIALEHRTHLPQDQAQCLLAAELSIRAQRNAKSVSIQTHSAAAARESRLQSG